jgi:hypothetical protein
MLGANVESFKNLEENLKAHGIRLSEIPHVIQFNKRDLPKLSGIEDLNSSLNKYNAPFYESVATTGIGVQDTLKAIVKLVLLNLTRKYESKTAAEAAAMASWRPPPRSRSRRALRPKWPTRPRRPGQPPSRRDRTSRSRRWSRSPRSAARARRLRSLPGREPSRRPSPPR